MRVCDTKARSSKVSHDSNELSSWWVWWTMVGVCALRSHNFNSTTKCRWALSWSDFFQMKIKTDLNRPKLLYKRKPCHDCAVTCGFYTEISHALKREPLEVQIAVSEKWFCHNDSSRACRGNSNYLGLTSWATKSLESFRYAIIVKIQAYIYAQM